MHGSPRGTAAPPPRGDSVAITLGSIRVLPQRQEPTQNLVVALKTPRLLQNFQFCINIRRDGNSWLEGGYSFPHG